MAYNKVLGERGSNKYRKETAFECGTCGKSFKPEGVLRYTMGSDDINLICPSCHDKWVRAHAIKNVVFDYSTSLQTVKVQYVGDDESYLSGPGILRGDFLRSELPQETLDKFRELEDAYRKDLNSKRIDKFEVIDTFESQEIHCTTRGGISLVIPFKVARDGKMLFDSSVEVPDYLMEQIMERLG